MKKGGGGMMEKEGGGYDREGAEGERGHELIY